MTHRQSLSQRFNHRAQPALLVVDVQAQFCNPAHGRGTAQTKAMAGRINRLVPHFRRCGFAIYPVYYSPYKADKPYDSDLYRFRPHATDRIIMKQHDSAFDRTGLLPLLHEKDHRDIYICGFNLHACVKRTALDAARFDFNTTIIMDMCGNDLWNQSKREWTTASLDRAGVHRLHVSDFQPFIR